jgi:hypothetical protein
VDDLRAYLDTHPRRNATEAPLFPARYGRNAAVPRSEASDGETYNWSVPIEPGTFYANYFRPARHSDGNRGSRTSTAVLQPDPTHLAALRVSDC